MSGTRSIRFLTALFGVVGLFGWTAAPLVAGPVAYWSLDNTANDSAGVLPGLNGTLNGGASFTADRPAVLPAGQSLSLNNATGYLSANPGPGTLAGSYTVSAWMKVNDSTTVGEVDNFFNTRTAGAEFSFDAKVWHPNATNVGIHGDIGNGASWNNTAADANLFSVGGFSQAEWHHVAYVVTSGQNTSGSANRYRIFVDGVQRANATFAGNPSLLWGGSRVVNIGRYGGSAAGSEYFGGNIADVAVWTNALSPQQIGSLVAGASPLSVGVNHHGAMKYLPITNDADSGIDALKSYTHKADFGSDPGSPANVNGVQFDFAGPNGAFPGGSTDIALSHNGNAATNTTGAISSLLDDFVYNHSAADPSVGHVVLNGLSPGSAYDLRLYVRQWAAPSTTNDRTNIVEFDVGGDGVPERSVRVNEDDSRFNAPGLDPGASTVTNRAYALSYNYVADASGTISVNLTQVGNGTFHVYGLSNEATSRRPIDSLFSTGLDAGGGRLVGGQADPHYTLLPGAAQGTVAIAIANHPAWAQNDAASGFIGVADPGTTNTAVGNYDYVTNFDLTGFNPDTTLLTLTMYADNRVNDVLVNGVSAGINFAGFAALANANTGKTFTIDAALLAPGTFLSGINTLEFRTANDSPVGPSGFRVDLSGSAEQVPEPATWVLASVGMLFIAPRIRRQMRSRG
ncbi:MAG: LamG domain-containing protein [Pirellulales bacterium]